MASITFEELIHKITRDHDVTFLGTWPLPKRYGLDAGKIYAWMEGYLDQINDSHTLEELEERSPRTRISAKFFADHQYKDPATKAFTNWIFEEVWEQLVPFSLVPESLGPIARALWRANSFEFELDVGLIQALEKIFPDMSQGEFADAVDEFNTTKDAFFNRAVGFGKVFRAWVRVETAKGRSEAALTVGDCWAELGITTDITGQWRIDSNKFAQITDAELRALCEAFLR